MAVSSLLKWYMSEQKKTYEEVSSLIADAEAEALRENLTSQVKKIEGMSIPLSEKELRVKRLRTHFHTELNQVGIATSTLKRIATNAGYCPSSRVLKKLELIFGSLSDFTEIYYGKGICMHFVTDKFTQFNMMFSICDICEDNSLYIDKLNEKWLYELVEGPHPIGVFFVSTHMNKLAISHDTSSVDGNSKGAFRIAVCPQCEKTTRECISMDYSDIVQYITSKKNPCRITQNKLAMRLKTTQSHISKITHKEIEYVPPKIALALHKIFIEQKSKNKNSSFLVQNRIKDIVDELTKSGIPKCNIQEDFKITIWSAPFMESKSPIEFSCNLLISSDNNRKKIACYIVGEYLEGLEYQFLYCFTFIKAEFLCLIPMRTSNESNSKLNNFHLFEKNISGLSRCQVNTITQLLTYN